MNHEYDLAILGGGTGGYVAAIRASQLGLKVAMIEKSKIGGTCLHTGCIPSKALLRSAEVYATAKRSEEYGIIMSNIQLDFQKIQNRKELIVHQLYDGVQRLVKKGKIHIYEGIGRILGPSIFSPISGTISVEMNNGKENELILSKNVIIATGSRPRKLPGFEIDGKYVMTSDEALKMTELPKSLIVVGGGVIGIEWASMLCDFDVEVIIVEYSDRILPQEDIEISREMSRLLMRKGIKIVTGAKVISKTVEDNGKVSVETEIEGQRKQFMAEKLLVSVGRQANIENIGIENTDIIIEKGFIQTNTYYQTKEPHIYAIGDVIGGMQLAHVAAHEGITAVEHIAGESPKPLNYKTIARCIYSRPEAASVGLTEVEAKEKGYRLKIGKFPFKAIGKALVYGEESGFVKIIANVDTEDILGIHMVGPDVTNMISEAGLAMVIDATPWEIAHIIRPHPSLSEAIGEAALAVDGKAIHM